MVWKKLSINGIDINIPCGLFRDLCAALKYAESKNKGPIKEGDYLFAYLYKYKGKFRVESLNNMVLQYCARLWGNGGCVQR